MLKMLIVEDERWEREGLVDFLDWSSFNIEIAGTACDGIEGFELALRVCPDIILADIKMPGMDGIQMSKKIKDFLPDSKIIILTGCDDFMYAKEAISFNASAYILKPFEDEEIKQVIQKVVDECEKERERIEREKTIIRQLDENLRIARAKFLNDLIEGSMDSETLQGLIEYFGIKTNINEECLMLAIKIQSEKSSDIEDIIDYFQKILDSSLIFSLIINKAEDAAFCLKHIPESADSMQSIIKKFFDKIAEDYGARAVVGIGEPVASICNIRHSYVQAKQAIEFGVFWEEFNVICFNDIDLMRRNFNICAGEFLIQGSYFTKQLLHAVGSLNEDRVYDLLGEMFDYIRSNRGAAKDFVVNYLRNLVNEISIFIYNLNKDYPQASMDENTWNDEPDRFLSLKFLEENIFTFFAGAIENVSEKKGNKDELILKKVMKLIDEKYMTDISLKIIAREVFLSPNYLGNIFKKCTGKPFNEYLCEYRMEKAKELLKNPKNKVNWVAAQVGLANTSYFCTIFKNTYGMTPGEYQEMILRG